MTSSTPRELSGFEWRRSTIYGRRTTNWVVAARKAIVDSAVERIATEQTGGYRGRLRRVKEFTGSHTLARPQELYEPW